MGIRLRRSLRRNAPGWGLMAPTVLVFAATGLYPLGYAAFLSLHRWRFLRTAEIERFVGLDNYLAILRDESYWWAMRQTVIFLAGTIPAEVVIGLALALALNVIPRGANLFRTVLLTPMLIMPVVVSLIWRLTYDTQFGPLNHFLLQLGVLEKPVAWLSEPSLAMASIIVATIWQWFPLSVLILSANLQVIPEEEYEVAELDGANAVQGFRYITLPHLLPGLLVILLMRLMDGFRTFAIVYNLTHGGPGRATNLISYYIYDVGFRGFDLGLGAAMALSLMLVMVLLAVALTAFTNRFSAGS